MRRPTRDELAAARGATVPDLVGPGLQVLLVGINPGLHSAAVGHHFARPGNRLWRTLHEAGLTPRLLRPEETDALLACGVGVTNLVSRATARADELSVDELRAGPTAVERLARRWQPVYVAVLGVSAYRVAFDRPRAVVGPQPERLGPAGLWVLPNPSGLNAHYQQPDLTRMYGDLAASLAPASPDPPTK